MTDEHMDDVFRELQDDLGAVRPSPEFAAKVRMRVEARPAHRWFGMWQVATATSIVMVALVAVAIWRLKATNTDAPAPTTVTAQNPQAPSPAATTVARPAESGHVVMAPGRTAKVSFREPEVLVPPDERIALMRFIASLQAGRAGDVPASVTSLDENTGELTAPKRIEIQPIVVELLPGTTDPRGGGRNDQ